VPDVVDVPDAQRFEIRVGDDVAGFVTYRRHDGSLVLVHTEIAPAFEGQGLGSRLARGVLESARDEGAGVLPYCPFLRSYLQRHPDYVPLVPEARRAEFGLSGEGRA
jgi:uncharacterized protein